MQPFLSQGLVDDLRYNIILTIIQTYQEDVWMIMKGCVQRNHIYDRKDSLLKQGSNTRPPLDRQASA